MARRPNIRGGEEIPKVIKRYNKEVSNISSGEEGFIYYSPYDNGGSNPREIYVTWPFECAHFRGINTGMTSSSVMYTENGCRDDVFSLKQVPSYSNWKFANVLHYGQLTGEAFHEYHCVSAQCCSDVLEHSDACDEWGDLNDYNLTGCCGSCNNDQELCQTQCQVFCNAHGYLNIVSSDCVKDPECCESEDDDSLECPADFCECRCASRDTCDFTHGSWELPDGTWDPNATSGHILDYIYPLCPDGQVNQFATGTCEVVNQMMVMADDLAIGGFQGYQHGYSLTSNQVINNKPICKRQYCWDYGLAEPEEQCPEHTACPEDMQWLEWPRCECIDASIDLGTDCRQIPSWVLHYIATYEDELMLCYGWDNNMFGEPVGFSLLHLYGNLLGVYHENPPDATTGHSSYSPEEDYYGPKVLVMDFHASHCSQCKRSLGPDENFNCTGEHGICREEIFNMFKDHEDFMWVSFLMDENYGEEEGIEGNDCESWGDIGGNNITPWIGTDPTPAGDAGGWNVYYSHMINLHSYFTIPKFLIIDKQGRLLAEENHFTQRHIIRIQNALNDESLCDNWGEEYCPPEICPVGYVWNTARCECEYKPPGGIIE